MVTRVPNNPYQPNAIKLKLGSLTICSIMLNPDRFPWILDDFSIKLVNEIKRGVLTSNEEINK